jgi:hypothetical protein
MKILVKWTVTVQVKPMVNNLMKRRNFQSKIVEACWGVKD